MEIPLTHWQTAISIHAGNGLKKAITLALKDAFFPPEDIDYISSTANSTKGLDMMETRVIKDVFGEHSLNIPVSSIKSMVGESFSASGALSFAAAVGAIKNGYIPPTVNYKEKDLECDLDYVPNKARQKNIKNVLVISSDPYGNNSAVIISEQVSINMNTDTIMIWRIICNLILKR